MKCQLDEVEFVIKVLKFANYAEEKLFICISSIMTWALANPKEKTEFLHEEDRFLRKTFPKYQFLLKIEDQCLEANHFKPNLRCFCIVSGIPYGNGEDILFPFFKAFLLNFKPFFSYFSLILASLAIRSL